MVLVVSMTPIMYSDPNGYIVVPILIIGAIIGFVVGFGVSVASQAICGNEISWGIAFFEGALGAITGALGASGIGTLGMMIAGGTIGFTGSVAGDLIKSNGDFGKIDWTKATKMGIFGAGLGALSGPGAQNISKMNSSINSGKSWLSKGFINLSDSVSNRGASGLSRQVSALALKNTVLGYQVQAMTFTTVASAGSIVISEVYGRGGFIFD